MIFFAPAKVNLSLWIKGKRKDSYHELITVMHTVSIYDVLEFTPSSSFNLFVEGEFKVPREGNLVEVAVKKFHKATGILPKFKIRLVKKIPVGAGLGGGSSDGAVVLKALNAIYGFPLRKKELYQIAKDLGSDVPFFLKGGLALCWGRGEKTLHFKPLNLKLLVVYPGFSCKTKDVYQEMPEIKEAITLEEAIKKVIKPLKNKDFKSFWENATNSLELSKSQCVREVLNLKGTLFKNSLMTGSGSSFFTILTAEKQAESKFWSRICQTV